MLETKESYCIRISERNEIVGYRRTSGVLRGTDIWSMSDAMELIRQHFDGKKEIAVSKSRPHGDTADCAFWE